MRERAAQLFRETQKLICAGLESVEPTARFREDSWDRTDKDGSAGGGGLTRILSAGAVFEKAGVNFSEVHGTLPSELSLKLTGESTDLPFFATGISLVIHPYSPLVPTTHANWRYLEAGGKRWFGGGSDLTPYYLFDEDAVHFHRTIKSVCDRHDPQFYPEHKKECDEYFFLPHRGETRGVGGIFFDYLGRENPALVETLFPLVSDLATTFIESYLPIVKRRKDLSFTDAQKQFQLLRRGRYVEFNLLYDRGTLFGLRTNGRVESILMSLPPEVRWEYSATVEPDSDEARLLAVLSNPRQWV